MVRCRGASNPSYRDAALPAALCDAALDCCLAVDFTAVAAYALGWHAWVASSPPDAGLLLGMYKHACYLFVARVCVNTPFRMADSIWCLGV